MRTFKTTLLVALVAMPSLVSAQTESKHVDKPPVTKASSTQSEDEETKVKTQPKSKTGTETKVAATPAVKQTFELTFDDLSFEMKKGTKFERTMLTETINSYHNSTVKLRGYIRPSFKQSGLTKFIFVRDNKECCFGGNAAIFDNVLVKLAKGTKTDFTVRPVTIEGKMYLKEYKGPDGRVWSIYRMSDTRMR